MTLRTGILAGLAAAAFLLAAVVSASSDGPVWDVPVTADRGTDRDDGPEPSCPLLVPDCDTRDGAADEVQEIPLWGDIAGTVVLVLISVGCLLILRGLVVGRRRRRNLAPGKPHEAAEGIGPREAAPERVVEQVEAGLLALAGGSPRNAVVAAWIELEEAAREAGLVRRPAETSAELTRRTLAAYAVDEGTLRRLGALYREARFSAHDLTEDHRVEARACLEQVRDALAGAVR